MGGLSNVRGVKTVVERIILDVVILERHHEGDESFRRYHDDLEQVPLTEGRVGDGGQRPVIAQFAYPEDVDAPLVDVVQQLREQMKDVQS